MTYLDFQGINEDALRNARSLLLRLIPGGKFRSQEYIVRNPKRTDRNPGSFKINYKTGAWSDFAIEGVKGGDLISLAAYVRDTSQSNAARELADMIGISVPKLSGARPGANGSKGDKRSRNVVMPVPGDAPTPPTSHPMLGPPTRTWTYEDDAGGVIGYVFRFDNSDGDKQFRPLTLWRDADGKSEWCWESWPVERPLYGLRELAERPSAAVVVSEGEKSADAARPLLPHFVVVTSPGGSESANKVDWSQLHDREVIIWPDADSPGHKYAQTVTKCLAAVGAKSVAVVSPPRNVKEGWDAADAFNEGWTPERVAELIRQAVPMHDGARLNGEPTTTDKSKRDEPTTYFASYASFAWPVMDDAAYHGIAGDIVRGILPHTEADPNALLIQTLTMAGNVIGRLPYYQVEFDQHRVNLFAVLVGASAKGRKGTSLGRIRSIVKVADETWSGDRIKGGLSSGEGFINEVRDPVQKYNIKKKCFEIADPGIADKRLMVVEPEFAGAISVAERHGNTLSPLIRRAWDGDKLATLTRNSPLTATGAHISIVGHITVDELRARISRTEMGNGFANRFLFALIRRSKELPFGGALTDSQILRLGEQLKSIIDRAKSVGRMEMTDAARSKWAAVYPELSAAKPGLLGAVIARAEAQTVRLAQVYALLDGGDKIDLPHLEAALAVWEYCELSAVHIFGDAIGDPVADEILRALQNTPDGMTRTAINDLFGRHQSSNRIGAALQLLATKGRARPETRQTSGRPSEIWFATGR